MLDEPDTTDSPLVSVIMPFLNPNRRFMKEAVESVLSQDYRPLEILAVDDGSGEKIDELIQDWCAGDDVPLRLLHHDNGENRGTSASRNLGVRHASGKYVAFLDADDIWLHGKIREQCAVMESNESLNLVFGLTRYWFEWHALGTGNGLDFTTRPGFRTTTVFSPPDYIAGMVRGRFLVPSASNILARRDSVLDCGGFDEEFTDLYDDQVFVAKLALTGQVCAVPKLWDKYRQHDQSMTALARDFTDEPVAREKYMSWLGAFCSELNLQYPTLAEAVAKDRWLASSAWTQIGSPAYRWLRWVKKWLLRAEESVIPESLRWKYWN